jgi:hypothetical protein
VIVHVVDIGGIVDLHCLNFLQVVKVNNSTNINNMDNHLSPEESLNSEGQLFHQYQQHEQSPLT